MDIERIKSVRESITKYFESGQFEEGLELFNREKGNLPIPVQLECRGNLHFYRRELQDAIKDYEAAISAFPDYLIARYQYLVGTQNEKKENFVGAFKRYQNAIEIEPTFVDAYIELGGLLGKVGDLEGAAKCYRDAARLDPNDLATCQNLKVVLSKLAKDNRAKYEEELASIEIVCEKLTSSGKKLPLRNQW